MEKHLSKTNREITASKETRTKSHSEQQYRRSVSQNSIASKEGWEIMQGGDCVHMSYDSSFQARKNASRSISMSREIRRNPVQHPLLLKPGDLRVSNSSEIPFKPGEGIPSFQGGGFLRGNRISNFGTGMIVYKTNGFRTSGIRNNKTSEIGCYDDSSEQYNGSCSS